MQNLLVPAFVRKRLDRSAFLQRTAWRFEAIVLTLFWSVSALMPPDRATAMGKRLFRFLGPRLRITGNMRSNLEKVLQKEYSDAEMERLIRDSWGNFGSVLAEFPHLSVIAGSEADQRLEIIVQGDIQALRDLSKPAVFVTAHLANWEIAAAAVVLQGVKLSVVFSPQKNLLVDRMLARRRRSLGYELLPKNSLRDFLRELAKGRSIGLLPDVRIDLGEPLRFFGITTPTTTTPARLALKFGCELVPVHVERLEGARFRVTFLQPIKPDDEAGSAQAKALQMTRTLNELFESWIRAKPHEWLCLKRRWPRTPPAPSERSPTVR